MAARPDEGAFVKGRVQKIPLHPNLLRILTWKKTDV